MNKIILTDADGVLLNWEYAFCTWMEQHGYSQIEKGNQYYDIAERFGIKKEEAKAKVKIFNESAAIGFLPALRDAMYYVKRLHEEHGYVFHCITSLSTDANAGKLREMNLRKLFGRTAFERVVCLETGGDKDEALEETKKYREKLIADNSVKIEDLNLKLSTAKEHVTCPEIGLNNVILNLIGNPA